MSPPWKGFVIGELSAMQANLVKGKIVEVIKIYCIKLYSPWYQRAPYTEMSRSGCSMAFHTLDVL